jgi:hypothetical protein
MISLAGVLNPHKSHTSDGCKSFAIALPGEKCRKRSAIYEVKPAPDGHSVLCNYYSKALRCFPGLNLSLSKLVYYFRISPETPFWGFDNMAKKNDQKFLAQPLCI